MTRNNGLSDSTFYLLSVDRTPVESRLNSEFNDSIGNGIQSENSFMNDPLANLYKFPVSQRRYAEDVQDVLACLHEKLLINAYRLLKPVRKIRVYFSSKFGIPLLPNSLTNLTIFLASIDY